MQFRIKLSPGCTHPENIRGLVSLCVGSFVLYDSSSEVVDLTESNFDRLVTQSDEVWVVEFFASWCGHCQQFVGIYSKAALRLSRCICTKMKLILMLISFHQAWSLPSEFGSLKHGFNDSWPSEFDMKHGSSRRFKSNDLEPPMFLLDRLDGSRNLQYCYRSAKCQRLNFTTCLGAKLPYSMTTLELVPTLKSDDQILDHFAVWKGLIHLPRCWAVIQPFLCALYMPKCENDEVFLPAQEMCKVLEGPCRILTMENAWPMDLRCHNDSTFRRGCKNDARELKFNTTGRCEEPMVPTDSPNSYYEAMEGCGVRCDNPMFTPDERYQIHRLVAWAATTCFLFNLFTVVTFMIDWKSSSKFPALVIFYINLCFLIVCLGWLAQFLPGGREDIVCRKDGTLRVGEPNARENLSCIVVFVFVYYFLMAGIVWFVILTYAYHISFQALGKIQERMDKKGAYFHLVAWSLPLVLTIATMALGEIDGNSVAGVCFVGSVNHEYRAIFFLVPVASALAVGGYFLFKGLLKLIRLKISSEEIISERASGKIKETIVRMGFFTVLIFVFGCTTFACHFYEFRNSPSWNASFRKYIVCRLVYVSEEHSQCRMEDRPSLAILQLHLLSLFATGIAMSSWVWTQSTVQTWKRFFARVTNKKTDELEAPVKVRKDKLIAETYAKRKMLNSNGRLSISIHSTYQDPVGLNFELNSAASNNLSTTWAATLPKLITRRGALTGVNNSNSSQLRNSMDSEISYSVRRVSVESRRHSLDSAVSVQVAELTKTVRKARTSHRHSRSTRQRRRRRSRHVGSRRGSSTSQESQMDAQILSALAIGGVEIAPVPSLKHNQSRRQGNAGLDDSLNILAQKLFGNLAGPLGLSQESEGSSDEEVTRVRETFITGRVVTNTNSVYSDEEKTAEKEEEEEEEEEVNTDDETEPLTKNCESRSSSCRMVTVGVATDCSISPDQLRNHTHHSATTESVGSHLQVGREIGTQTNVSFSNKDRSPSVGSRSKRKTSNASKQKPSSTESSLK